MSRLRTILLIGYLLTLVASHIASQRVRAASHPREDQAVQRLSDGVEMAYSQVNPDAGGIPVVLLHGSPMGSRCFEEYPAAWGERRLIMPDMPGFGGSTLGVTNLSIASHAAWTLEWLEAIGVQKAHLVGYSMGGGVGLEMMGADPDRFVSYTLLAGIGVQEEELTGDYQINHLLHGIQLAVLYVASKAVPHFGAWDRAILTPNYARNFFDTDQRPLRGILEKMSQPFLVLQGDRDGLVLPAAARENARIVPQSELHWLDGGHMTVLSQPERVIPVLKDFWDRVENGTVVTRAKASTERLAAAKAPYQHEPFRGRTLLVIMLVLILAIQASEDLTLIGAGMLVGKGILGFWPATVACFLGLVLGDAAIYLMGRFLGPSVLRRRPFRWLVSEKDVRRQKGRFQRNLGALVVSSRFMPGMRLPMYFAAGVARAGFWKFVLWLCIASLIWAPILVGLSAWFGSAFTSWFSEHKGLALFGLFGAVFFLWLFFKKIVPLATWRGRRLALSGWRRFSRWEFWPRFVFYTPVFLYILWLMLRHRSISLPMLANHGMPNSGLLEDRKSEIFTGLSSSAGKALPPWALLPVGDKADVGRRMQQLQDFLNCEDLRYPIVLKPDLGCRGQGVGIIHDQESASKYLRECDVNVIVQPYIGGQEYGVFYERVPGEEKGQVTGITRKELTTVTGDGKQTLEKLILRDDRAVCMAPFFLEQFSKAGRLAEVPAAGTIVPLAMIGTHCRGALFFDDTHLATPALSAALDELTRGYEGFHLGRFDLRVPSPEALQRGEGIRILELNGLTSESTQIYDPRHSVWYGWKTIMGQWRRAFAYGAILRKQGMRPCGLLPVIKLLVSSRQNVTEFEA